MVCYLHGVQVLSGNNRTPLVPQTGSDLAGKGSSQTNPSFLPLSPLWEGIRSAHP